MTDAAAHWQFWIDRGGTFTDVVAKRPDGALVTHKLLSENPEQYDDAALQGIRELLGVGRGEAIQGAAVDAVKMGTTVATNALLERKGERTVLVITEGFADALRIAYQNRPRLFDRHIKLPELLYERVVTAFAPPPSSSCTATASTIMNARWRRWRARSALRRSRSRTRRAR
jgi:5-oxoprolinase (ATP-hydrolysing)